MTSNRDKPANGDASDAYFIVSGDDMNRLVIPLTVLHGHLQLLRRRHAVTGSDDLTRALAQMEDASRAITAQLQAIMGTTSTRGEIIERD